jgi:hypothetical protein
MRFTEIDLFGVFVSPMAVMLLAAWVVLQLVRRIADRMGLWRHLWHPALASTATYVIVLSAIIVLAAR